MVETVLLVKAHLEGGVFATGDEEVGEGEEEGPSAAAAAAASSAPAPSSAHAQKTRRVIVWAHNSHLGDARATAMSRRGECNVGQLLRQHFEQQRSGGKGRAVLLSVGFSTFSGTVCAAARWGGSPLCRGIRPGMRGSYEELLHKVARLLQRSAGGGGERGEEEEKEKQQLSAVAAALNSSSPGAFLLDFRRGGAPSSSSDAQTAMIDALSEPRLERAIGVLYVRSVFFVFFSFFSSREERCFRTLSLSRAFSLAHRLHSPSFSLIPCITGPAHGALLALLCGADHRAVRPLGPRRRKLGRGAARL